MNYFDERFGHRWADADLAAQIRRAQRKVRPYPEQAMRLFWTKGYKNTGLRDLLKAMKIGESLVVAAHRSPVLQRLSDVPSSPQLFSRNQTCSNPRLEF